MIFKTLMRNKITWVIVIIVVFVIFAIIISNRANTIYTKRSIEILCRTDVESIGERIFEIDGKEINSRAYTVKDENNYFNEVIFYVFSSKANARKTFENLSLTGYQESAVRTENTVDGYLTGVFDASIDEFSYLTENMIINVTDNYYSEWPVSEDDSQPDTTGYRKSEEEIQELHELIMQTF